MALLRQQIETAIEAQERALKAMQARENLIENNRTKIKGADTNAAVLFDNQLLVDELSLRVEIGTTQFRLSRLRQYLVDNFSNSKRLGAILTRCHVLKTLLPETASQRKPLNQESHPL
jgi:hypothetical protein